MTDPADHVARNRAAWDAFAADWVRPGRHDWARNWPCEEIWKVRKRG